MTSQDQKPMAQSPQGSAQPESLATFDATARNAGRKPEEDGLESSPETAPRPDDPPKKNETAAAVLRAGVEKDPDAATKAAQSRKDPRTGL